MSLRSSTRRRGHLANLAPPAFLFLLVQTANCGGAPTDPAARLALEFPEHAQAVLGSGRGFARAATGFTAAPAPLGFRQTGRVDLPGDGRDAVVLHGANGFEARVREVGAAGAGRVVDHAVVYPREGGASFWTTSPGGAEEWIEVAAGRATADRPVATWRITGAAVRARGAAVELVGADGKARVRATAPAAYTASGRRIDARLRAGSASTIELFADARGEAALVDPMWIIVAPLLAPRADHASAIMGSGQVLATGGTDGDATSLDTAELYDPTGDAWTDVGPMGDAHVCHTATTLTDGTVLVAGGVDADGNAEHVAEIYNATSGWADTDQSMMAYTRLNHTATPINNGRVLVTGGLGYYYFSATDAPAGATKAVAPNAALAKSVGLSATRASAPGFQPEGIIGFYSICWNFPFSPCGGPGTINAVEIYDPMLGGWIPAASLNQPHQRHTATLLTDGTVLVTGGQDNYNVLGDTEIYDPKGDAWTTTPTGLITPREDHVAAILPNGDVLVAGGTDGNSGAITAAEIFHAGQWMAANPMTTARVHATATVLADGTVLVAGGSDGSQPLTSAEIYDPVAGSWALTASMNFPRSEHTATRLTSGDVLVSGGVDDTFAASVTAEVYEPILGNGAPCTDGSQCVSTFCVDGVCCGTVCAGASVAGGGVLCEACSMAMGATADGTCSPINETMVCAESPCMISGTCQAGTCSHTTPKLCTPVDTCHEPGICDPKSGTCPEGVARIDGSPCTGGVCVAGACVLDPTITPATSSTTGGGGGTTSTTTTVTSSVTAGTGGTGGGTSDPDALLSGNGCTLDASGAGGASGGAAAGLLAALLAAFRRRRR